MCEQPPMVVTIQGGNIYNLAAAQTAAPAFTPAAGSADQAVTQADQPTAQALDPNATPLAFPTFTGIAPDPGGQSSADSGTQTSSAQLNNLPPAPLLTTAFLELPFPYDGGNQNFGGTDEQFRTASQRNAGGNRGRINSFMDHLSPLYPAPKDPGLPGGQESPEEPAAGRIMVYWGVNDDGLNYSGHPGLDFSTYEYMQPTTPVFAAADGVITFAGTHRASGALLVKIKHTVAGVGDFETQYWHLNPDEFFDVMLGTEGQTILAGQRIGTMGNTGFSTGHHLHFEVRFDSNQDGKFPQTEVVDPYGWLGSADQPDDPWALSGSMRSNYLWKHPLGSTAVVPENGGGGLAAPGGSGGALPSQQICVLPGTLPPGGTVNYSWAPDPDPQNGSAGTGNGCSLNVKDAQGQPVTHFNNPVRINIPFSPQDLEGIEPQSLTIYWQSAGSSDWTALPTTLDLENRIASAETSAPGLCSLMGVPTADTLPPNTQISISAEQAPDGAFYSEATVSLNASDPSGVQTTYYSLDAGTTWKKYEAPSRSSPPASRSQPSWRPNRLADSPGRFWCWPIRLTRPAMSKIRPATNTSQSIHPKIRPTTSRRPLRHLRHLDQTQPQPPRRV